MERKYITIIFYPNLEARDLQAFAEVSPQTGSHSVLRPHFG